MISILTPSYNYGRFIDDCLASVAEQRLDAEQVVQDNVSLDGTVERLAAADPAVVTWVSEPDGGQSDALNRAFSRAEGDVIGWLNADEFYLPGAFEVVTRVFGENPNVDVVYGDTVFSDVRGGFRRLLTRIPFSSRILTWRGCYISTCSMFVRRSALEGFAFDTRLRLIMDWDMYLHLAARRSVFAYVPSALAVFRAHNERATAQQTGRDSEEHERVRQRYGIVASRGEMLARRALADAEFRARKALNGASQREARALSAVPPGASLVWMHGCPVPPAIELLTTGLQRRRPGRAPG